MALNFDNVDPTDADGMLTQLTTAVTLLAKVVSRMNSGVSYWGDAFNEEEYNAICACLKRYGINYQEE